MGRGELCRVTSQSSRPCTLLTQLLTFPTLFFPYFSISKSPKYFLRQPPSHLPISRSILPALLVLCFPLPLCAPQLKLSLFSGCHCRHPILPPRLVPSPLLHTSITALMPQPCQLPALEKHQGFKNLGRGCNCESFPGLHFEGSKCGKETQLCLRSQTGKTPWWCSPSMQGTSFTGEEHKVGASCKRVQCLRLDQPTIRKQVVYQTDNKNNKV